MDIRRFPEWYKPYCWQDKHSLFGYALTNSRHSNGLTVLKRAFCIIDKRPDSSPLFLVREMIHGEEAKTVSSKNSTTPSAHTA